MSSQMNFVPPTMSTGWVFSKAFASGASRRYAPTNGPYHAEQGPVDFVNRNLNNIPDRLVDESLPIPLDHDERETTTRRFQKVTLVITF